MPASCQHEEIPLFWGFLFFENNSSAGRCCMEFCVNKDQLSQMLEDYLLSKDYILADLMLKFLNIMDKNELQTINVSISVELTEMVRFRIASKIPVPQLLH